MIDDAKDLMTDFKSRFKNICSVDEQLACSCLLSTFFLCYQMLEKERKILMMNILCLVAAEIGDEKFEDESDFADFLIYRHTDELNFDE